MLNYIYALKVLLCSAILVAYYFIALRNKLYHQYNRFYLQLSVVLAWTIPLLNFNFFITKNQVAPTIYEVIDFTSKYNYKPIISSLPTIENPATSYLTLENITVVLFTLISIYFLAILAASFYKIYRLKKAYKPTQIGKHTIYLTTEKYTPYSFMNLIFWNNKIDLESKLGKQILQHELVHIKEKHSIDKVLMQLNLIVGWFNPFFWIIKNELEMIHEFIADRKSVPNADTKEFATMILSIAQLNKNIALTNPFFFSPIKRRLEMLNKNKNVKYSYIQKLLSLPILVGLIILLSFKTKQNFATIKPKMMPSSIVLNTTPIQKRKQIIVTEKLNENTAELKSINQTKDTVTKSIDALHNEFLLLEKQYKQEAAIASERKKLMLLIQNLVNLNDDQMLTLFKVVTNLDDVSVEMQKQQTKQLIAEYEKVLGNSNFKKFWKARNDLKKETLNYLNN